MVPVAWHLHRISALLALFLIISYNFVMKNCLCTYDFTKFRCRILACLDCNDRSWWYQCLIGFVFSDHIEIWKSFCFIFNFRTDEKLALLDDLSMILIPSSPIVKFCDLWNGVWDFLITVGMAKFIKRCSLRWHFWCKGNKGSIGDLGIRATMPR